MKRLILCFIATTLFLSSTAWTQQATLNFQGVLREPTGAAVPDGAYQLTFKLYDAANSGSLIWTEVQSSVEVKNGIFSADLGSVTPFTGVGFDQEYWLGITVGTDAELTPRSRLTSAPYALSLVGADNKFPSSGNVGIGTASPAKKLHVEGDSYFNGKIGIGANAPSKPLQVNGISYFNGNVGIKTDGSNTATIDLAIGDYDTGLDQISDGILAIKANGSEKMRITSSGNVGIGTDSPGAPLQISPSTNANPANNGLYIYNTATTNTSHAILAARVNGASAGDPFLSFDVNGVIGWSIGIDNSDDDKLKFANDWDDLSANTRMTIKTNGYVGIGTTDPKAPLHVVGSSYAHSNDMTWIDRCIGMHDGGGGSYTFAPAGIFSSDVLVTGKIVGLCDIDYSDVRSKKVIGQSDRQTDLDTIRKLTITDYNWIDTHYGQNEKKLIAQEVKEIYPQAVSYIPKAIPNVFQMAQSFSYDKLTKHLTISTDKPHDCQPGDFMEIHTDTEKLSQVEVEAAPTPNTVVIACEKAPERVFVYGKWVDDFHAVDYDAISMLNVSATQALADEVDALKAENAALKLELTTVTSKLAEFERFQAEFAAFKEFMRHQKPSVVQTSMKP